MTRFDFLQALGASTLAAATPGPAPNGIPFYDRVESIVPIRADPDNLIRVTVCTRPFRTAGPRLVVLGFGLRRP